MRVKIFTGGSMTAEMNAFFESLLQREMEVTERHHLLSNNGELYIVVYYDKIASIPNQGQKL